MFDGLYEVISKDKEYVVIKLTNKKHPIFKAHFPRHPVLPGFLHFEIVADVFGIEITSIKKAKFMDLVVPNQTLTYIKKASKFRVLRDDKEVASFSV